MTSSQGQSTSPEEPSHDRTALKPANSSIDNRSAAHSSASQPNRAGGQASRNGEVTAEDAGTNDYWRFRGGVVLSRKIDLVAFAAFFLSIGTIVIQLSAWFKGADLKLLPPDQVFIWKAEYSDNVPRALFGATLIYVNKGEKGYGAIVRREAVHVTVAGKDFEQGWSRFTTFKDAKPTNDKPAIPFSVDGGAAETHQTAFVPWPRECSAPAQTSCDVQQNHVKWVDFISELRRLVKAGQREYKFTFTSETIDNGVLPAASCKIAIDEPTISAIDQFQPYGPTCFPE